MTRRQYEIFYQEHYSKLLPFAVKHSGGDQDLAEDILQITFVKLLDKIPDHVAECREKLTSYFYNSILNTAKDYFKARKNQETLPGSVFFDSEELHYTSFSCNPYPEADSCLYTQETFDAVFGSFPDKEKTAMDMFVRGFEYTEIAKEIGFASKSGAHRTIQKALSLKKDI